MSLERIQQKVYHIRQDGRIQLQPGILPEGKVAISLEKGVILATPHREDQPVPTGALLRKYTTKHNLIVIPKVFLRVADEYADSVVVTKRADGTVAFLPIKDHCAFCGKKKQPLSELHGKKICVDCITELKG